MGNRSGVGKRGARRHTLLFCGERLKLLDAVFVSLRARGEGGGGNARYDLHDIEVAKVGACSLKDHLLPTYLVSCIAELALFRR